MNPLGKLLKNRTAKSKSKKSIISTIITITVVGGIGFFFAGEFGAIWGILLAVAIALAVGVAAFFALKHFDDLPDLTRDRSG